MDQQVQANCSTPREGSKVGLELDGHVIPTQIKDDSMVLRILDKVHTVSDAEYSQKRSIRHKKSLYACASMG